MWAPRCGFIMSRVVCSIMSSLRNVTSYFGAPGMTLPIMSRITSSPWDVLLNVLEHPPKVVATLSNWFWRDGHGFGKEALYVGWAKAWAAPKLFVWFWANIYRFWATVSFLFCANMYETSFNFCMLFFYSLLLLFLSGFRNAPIISNRAELIASMLHRVLPTHLYDHFSQKAYKSNGEATFHGY